MMLDVPLGRGSGLQPRRHLRPSVDRPELHLVGSSHASTPLVWWFLFVAEEPWPAAILLGVLGASDWVDGWIARRFDQGSALGKILDPVADRILLLSGVLALLIDDSVPRWYGTCPCPRGGDRSDLARDGGGRRQAH